MGYGAVDGQPMIIRAETDFGRPVGGQWGRKIGARGSFGSFWRISAVSIAFAVPEDGARLKDNSDGRDETGGLDLGSNGRL